MVVRLKYRKDIENVPQRKATHVPKARKQRREKQGTVTCLLWSGSAS